MPDSATAAPSDVPTPPDTEPTSPNKIVVEKTVLRLDAFLGEWLTPGYFELITPPPGSSLMLASAKANLLRREDYSNNPNFTSYNNQNASQTWGSPNSTPSNPLETVSSLAEALKRAGRSDSVTSTTSNGESRLVTGGAYVAPVPAYAISHNAEIPNGYVPHARDNCCDVDYQWDSMRGTLDWGDGGSLGEEWTSMHQRFRKGLQKLVDWYSTADHPSHMVTKERRNSVSDDYVLVDDEDVEVESVVILVSHGAGCNALIGAITHQPVLTDVGLASLTEALRKPGVSDVQDDGVTKTTSGSNTVSHPHGLVAIHKYYDLKLFASSEHLSSTRGSRSGSVGAPPPSRGRMSSTSYTSSPLSGTGGGISPGDASRSSSAMANLGSMRRDSGSSSRIPGRISIGLNTSGLSGLNGGITVGSGATSFTKPTYGIGGLWSPLRNSLDTPDDDDDNFLPNFSSFDSAPPNRSTGTTKAEEPANKLPEPSTPKTTNGSSLGRNRSGSTVSPRTNAENNNECAIEDDEESRDRPAALPQLGFGAGGLWGSPKPLADDISRDLTSQKRRWTVNDRC